MTDHNVTHIETEIEPEVEFTPLESFYAVEPKPKPLAKPKSEQITFAIMQRKDGKFSAAISIGFKVLKRLNWNVGDKVAIGIGKGTRKVQVYLAGPDNKHVSTLGLTHAAEPMAKFTFTLRSSMGIPLTKIRAQETTFALNPRHKFAGFLLEPSGEDFELHIDVPTAPAAEDETAEQVIEEGEE